MTQYKVELREVVNSKRTPRRRHSVELKVQFLRACEEPRRVGCQCGSGA